MKIGVLSRSVENNVMREESQVHFVDFGSIVIPYDECWSTDYVYCGERVQTHNLTCEITNKLQAEEITSGLDRLKGQEVPLRFDDGPEVPAFHYNWGGSVGGTLHIGFTTLSRDRASDVHRDVLRRFQSLIDDEDTSEQQIHEFFLQNACTLYHWFPIKGPLGHGLIYSKIPLGNDYVTDFVAYWENTGGDNWALIEIERASHRLFTKSGNPSAQLTHALRQVKDWSAWVSDNVAFARQLMHNINNPPSIIFIGRRDTLTDRDRRWLRELNDTLNGRPLITTYDSILQSNTELMWIIERQIYGMEELRKLTPSTRGLASR